MKTSDLHYNPSFFSEPIGCGDHNESPFALSNCVVGEVGCEVKSNGSPSEGSSSQLLSTITLLTFRSP